MASLQRIHRSYGNIEILLARKKAKWFNGTNVDISARYSISPSIVRLRDIEEVKVERRSPRKFCS